MSPRLETKIEIKTKKSPFAGEIFVREGVKRPVWGIFVGSSLSNRGRFRGLCLVWNRFLRVVFRQRRTLCRMCCCGCRRPPGLSPGLVPVSSVYVVRLLPCHSPGLESRPHVFSPASRPRVSVACLRFCLSVRVSGSVSRSCLLAPASSAPVSRPRLSAPSLGPRLADYSTSRFVAVSGKMTQGRNCLASSKSIRA